MHLLTRREFLTTTFAGFSLAQIVGCGTVLHPERRGQPAGPLDWKIVALDGIGLLFFFVPGVIAFAVDFSTGAIYLPPRGYGYERPAGEIPLVRVESSRKRLSMQHLEEIVSRHVERDVRLSPGGYKTEELKTLDDFWPTAEKLAAS